MRRIAMLNQKGGVGKTTTCVNLAAALARSQHPTLLIDLDPQTHLTLHVGLDPRAQPSMYEVLLAGHPLDTVVQPVGDYLAVAGSHIDLAGADVELAGVSAREMRLRDALAGFQQDFDFVFVDCPPSLGLLTLNALAAADEVFIPLQPHFLALQGFGRLLETVALVRQRINPRLQVTGIVLCLFEQGTRLAAEVVEDLQAFLQASRDQGRPWSRARIFRTCIRRNVKLAECPSHGLTIFDYAPRSHGAEDYEALGGEVGRMANELALPTSTAAGSSAVQPIAEV